MDFLETEMFGSIGGYQKFLTTKDLTSDYFKELKLNPLYPVIRFNVFKDWRVLGRCQSPEEYTKLYAMCFVNSSSDLEASILLRELNEKK